MEPIVTVSKWGELKYEKPVRDAVRVLVNGQYVGWIIREGDTFTAAHAANWTRARRGKAQTSHATPEDALKRVVRSGCARDLGATTKTRVIWSAKARKAMGIKGN